MCVFTPGIYSDTWNAFGTLRTDEGRANNMYIGVVIYIVKKIKDNNKLIQRIMSLCSTDKPNFEYFLMWK